MRFVGYTAIEFLIVIAIIAALISFGMTRYADVSIKSQDNTILTLEKSIRSAASFAHLQQRAKSLDPNDSVVINGKLIRMSNGYPREYSIGALVDLSGFQYDRESGIFSRIGKANCHIDYDESSFESDEPSYKIDKSGC